MWYLIKNGRVIDRSNTQFPVHPSLEWVQSVQNYEPGWTNYAAGVFTPITPPQTTFTPDPRDEAIDLLLNTLDLSLADQVKLTRLKAEIAANLGQ